MVLYPSQILAFCCHKIGLSFSFLPRDSRATYMYSVVGYAVAQYFVSPSSRPPVCPSHGGIVLKRLKASSRNKRRMVD